MCGLALGLRYVALKTIGGKQKQKAQMANGKLVETDARIGRKTNAGSLVKAPRQKALAVCLINWCAAFYQNSCRYVRVANTAAPAAAAAEVIGVFSVE